jgi:putative tricarboxylic transport membrane protein
MYVLASVILAYCAIGVFALHNITFDIWVMFGFGVIGYFMRKLGFPLAPMILGVVLGKLAELNIARAIGTSDDYFLFVTRPWSLFFIMMAIVSIIFPFYQNANKDSMFSKLYVPICMMVLSFPLFLMGSPVRMIIAAILLLAGSYFVYKRTTTLQVT